MLMLQQYNSTRIYIVKYKESIVISKESELHHSIGSLIDGAHPGLKTDRDYLGRYCP